MGCGAREIWWDLWGLPLHKTSAKSLSISERKVPYQQSGGRWPFRFTNLWALGESSFQRAQHTVDIHLGLPGSLDSLLLLELLWQRSWGGLALELIYLSGYIWCPSLRSWLTICRTLSSLETWDHLHLKCLNVCVANSSKRTKHIHVTSPWEFRISMRRKNWVSTPNTKPWSSPETLADSSISDHRRCNGAPHLQGIP